jgi:hypothetical protein
VIATLNASTAISLPRQEESTSTWVLRVSAITEQRGFGCLMQYDCVQDSGFIDFIMREEASWTCWLRFQYLLGLLDATPIVFQTPVLSRNVSRPCVSVTNACLLHMGQCHRQESETARRL